MFQIMFLFYLSYREIERVNENRDKKITDVIFPILKIKQFGQIQQMQRLNAEQLNNNECDFTV